METSYLLENCKKSGAENQHLSRENEKMTAPITNTQKGEQSPQQISAPCDKLFGDENVTANKSSIESPYKFSNPSDIQSNTLKCNNSFTLDVRINKAERICETVQGEENFCTPDKPTRKRKLTSRLGIDDITLNEAVHHKSPKIRLTPSFNRSVIIPVLKKSELCSKSPVMHITSGEDAPVMCDKYDQCVPSSKRRRISSQFEKLIDENKELCCKRIIGSNCGYHERVIDSSSIEVTHSEFSEKEQIKLSKDDRGGEKLQCTAEHDRNGDTDVQMNGLKSPDKFWSVVSRTESPHGEIKLCINRKKKSKVSLICVISIINWIFSVLSGVHALKLITLDSFLFFLIYSLVNYQEAQWQHQQ